MNHLALEEQDKMLTSAKINNYIQVIHTHTQHTQWQVCQYEHYTVYVCVRASICVFNLYCKHAGFSWEGAW